MIIEIALGIVLAVIILRMLPAIIVAAYYALGLLISVAGLGVVCWLATDSATYQPFWGMVGIVSFSAVLLWSMEVRAGRKRFKQAVTDKEIHQV